MADYEGMVDRQNRQIDKLIEALANDVTCPSDIELQDADPCKFNRTSCTECWHKALEGVE